MANTDTGRVTVSGRLILGIPANILIAKPQWTCSDLSAVDFVVARDGRSASIEGRTGPTAVTIGFGEGTTTFSLLTSVGRRAQGVV